MVGSGAWPRPWDAGDAQRPSSLQRRPRGHKIADSVGRGDVEPIATGPPGKDRARGCAASQAVARARPGPQRLGEALRFCAGGEGNAT